MTNTWEVATWRFEEAITIGRAYLFEVVVFVIIVVAIRLAIEAFQRWNPVQLESGATTSPSGALRQDVAKQT